VNVISKINGMNGHYYHGIALTVPCVSTWLATQQQIWLESKLHVARATSWFLPSLQQSLHILLIETPLSCDALGYVSGLTGPGTPLFQNPQ
jgi:hypothetical protein